MKGNQRASLLWSGLLPAKSQNLGLDFIWWGLCCSIVFEMCDFHLFLLDLDFTFLSKKLWLIFVVKDFNFETQNLKLGIWNLRLKICNLRFWDLKLEIWTLKKRFFFKLLLFFRNIVFLFLVISKKKFLLFFKIARKFCNWCHFYFLENLKNFDSSFLISSFLKKKERKRKK